MSNTAIEKEAVRTANPVEQVLPAMLGKPTRAGSGGELLIECPWHDDRAPSLRISPAKQVWFCDPCDKGGDVIAFVQQWRGIDFAEALKFLANRAGLHSQPCARIVQAYPYTDERGTLLYEVVRFEPKDFRQRRPDGAGGYAWTLGAVRRVLYRLADLPGCETVVIVEGEKDVDALWALDLPATTNAGGAGKWRAEHVDQLRAAGVQRVVVLPDNDITGRAHADAVAASCAAGGLAVQMLTLPDQPEKGDASDYLTRRSPADLRALLATAPEWTPPANIALPSAQPSPIVDPADYEQRVSAVLEQERAKRDARRRLAAEERGAIVFPEIETLRDRLARPVPITRWRIHGWQPRDSRVMLAAQFKAGKTTLIGNLLRSLVDGDQWLGRDMVDPVDGAVVLLDFEMAPAQIDGWLRAQRIRGDDRVRLVPMRGLAATFNLLDDDLRARWAECLRRCGAGYVVLDCLRPVLDAVGLDEHSEAGRFLVAFDALLSEAGIPEACIVHHMGHTAERSRGDSRLRDWPDVEWRVVRHDDKDPASARYITAYGRDVDQPESQLTYDPDTRRLLIAGGSRQDAKCRAALDVVRTAIGGRELSGRAIKEELKENEIPRDTIEAALRLGVETGKLALRHGANRAKLYRLNPVSGCPAVSG